MCQAFLALQGESLKLRLPPSLSEFGKLNLSGTKCHLLQCIEEAHQTEAPVLYDCKVLDGGVTIHALPVINVSAFQEYAGNIFIPHLECQLCDTKRVDVVWDEYRPDSLKEGTREKQGKSVRRKVSGDTKLPGDWNDFLRDPINKKELFNSCHQKLWIAAALLSVRYISQPESMLHVLERRSKCPAAIRKKQTLGLWFT
jgi:hypothetical protein